MSPEQSCSQLTIATFGTVGLGRESNALALQDHAEALGIPSRIVYAEQFISPFEVFSLATGYQVLSPLPEVYRRIRARMASGAPKCVDTTKLDAALEGVPLVISVSANAKDIISRSAHSTPVISVAGDRIVYQDEVSGDTLHTYVVASRTSRHFAERVPPAMRVLETGGFPFSPLLLKRDSAEIHERLTLGAQPHVVVYPNGSGHLDVRRIVDGIASQVRDKRFVFSIFAGHFGGIHRAVETSARRHGLPVNRLQGTVSIETGAIHVIECADRTATLRTRPEVLRQSDIVYLDTTNELTHVGVPVFVDPKNNRNYGEDSNAQIGESLGYVRPVKGALGEEIIQALRPDEHGETKAQQMLAASRRHNNLNAGERMLVYSYEAQRQILGG